MNKIVKYCAIICASMAIAFTYNAKLTIAIIIADIVFFFLVSNEVMEGLDKEKILDALPNSMKDIVETAMLQIANQSMNVCLIILVYNLIKVICN